ncbi:hypothetical protein TNIN_152351, partial [Trichonephila inaurata madagascariensis]
NILAYFKKEMSNSEDDSSAEVENKVQQDTSRLKSTEKSLKTESALQNPKKDEASAAPSYFKQQTLKTSIKPDPPNIRVSGGIKKSTKTAQEMPVESVSGRNRKASCSKDSSVRYKDSKKRTEIKPGTSKGISEDKSSSHLSDMSRNPSKTSSKIKTQLISDASKTPPTDKSLFKLIARDLEVEAKRIDLLLEGDSDLIDYEFQRALYSSMVPMEVVESSPAQSRCVKQKIGKQNEPSLNQDKSQSVQTNPLDIGREVASAKKSETSAKASASKDYKYPPGTYFAEPTKIGSDSPRVKSIVKIFEDLQLQEDCRKEMERKQRRGMSEDNKQRVSDIAAETSMIGAEKIQSSSTTRTNFPNERSFISPGKVQQRSRRSLSNERISSFISTEKARLEYKTRTSVPNTKMSSLIDSGKTPSRSKAGTSLPNKRISPLISTEKARPKRTARMSFPNKNTQLSSPEKSQLGSRARTSFLDEGTRPLISPEMIQSISRVNLSNEKISSLMNTEQAQEDSRTRIGVPKKGTSPLIGTEKNRQSKTKISLPDERASVISPEEIQLSSKARISLLNEKTSLSSPEKAQLGSRSRTNLLNEKTLPKKQSEHVTVQSDAGREAMTASDTQPSILHGRDVPAVCPLKYEEIGSSSTERQSDSKVAVISGCLSSENKDDLTQSSFEFQGAIAIEHPSSKLEATRKEIEEFPDGSETTAVEPLQQWEPIGSEQEMDSPGQQAAGGELENVDLSAQQMSPNALFEMLQEIKIDRRFDAWMELLRIFYTTGRIHIANELKTVTRKIYDERVIKDFYDYWTRHGQTRRSSTKGGYFEENDLLFRRLKDLTSRIGEMTMAMFWLDVRERTRKLIHARKQLRGRSTTLHNVNLSPPSNSESSSDLNQNESSKEPQAFSSQKLQEHVKIDVGDKKPKQIDRGKVLGSKPTSKIGSSNESSLEEKFMPQFDRVCKENLLLRELLGRKRTSSPFREKRKVSVDTPVVDSVASPRTGSSGDLLSKCTQIKEKDASGDTFSKHSDSQEVENSENKLKNLHSLPLNEPDDGELLEIFDKIFGDMFASFIQNNMNNV